MLLAILLGLCGCPSTGSTKARSVQNVTEARSSAARAAPGNQFDTAQHHVTQHNAIATVNGIPIARARIVELLLRAHGAGVLEQLVGLELAGQLAAKRGLSVRESDIEFEYNLALRRLSDPLAMVTPEDFDRQTPERVLDSVLAERNISHEEFLITIRRNAYLRKVVEDDLMVSQDELRAEYDRVYGERAEVRHIQLGSDGDVRRVLQRLAAGDDFESLANRYSANIASARRGGLLEPFSRNDQAVPEAFRRIAFSLSPGEVSDVVQIGEWRHIIRLERMIPADKRGIAEVRSELEPQLRGRLAEEKMRDLLARLMREASINISDSNVREAFTKRRQGQP